MKVSDLESFGESLLVQDYQNQLPVLSIVLEGQVQTQITTCPGESRLAGVLEKKFVGSAFFKFSFRFSPELFYLRYKYRSIDSYRSAISAYYCYVMLYCVRQHKQLCALLRGVFTKKPPHPRYAFTWDVKNVLILSKING